MDFELTEEQRLIRDAAREFLQKEIAPLVEEYEAERKLITKDIIKKLEPLGYTKALIPESMGGLELDFLSYCLMVKELSRVWGSLRTLIVSTASVAFMISKMGTQRQMDKFLPGFLAMDYLGSIAITEPNVGSDASAIETLAVRDGDHYVLNGTKTLITGGSMADVILVFATLDRSKKGKGITAFLVSKAESKIETSNILKMGMNCSVLSELHFDDCRVPVENRLGDEGKGLSTALYTLNMGRVTVAFTVLGLAEVALEASIRYAKNRVQFGKTIANFQLVQEIIVDMSLKVAASSLLAYKAADLVDKGVDCRLEASYAKLFASEAALAVTDKGIQIHGGYGYTQEYPVERYYRDLRHLTLAEGTTEIQKLIIGREILGVSALV